MKKKGNKVLGRGLEALFVDNRIKSESRSDIQKVEVDRIIPNENQPRKKLDHITELAESIKMHGILQPIILLDLGGKFQIIAGERRWRASKLAGLKKIPAIIKESLSSKDKLEVALIENIQRQNLNVIEEARAYKQLLEGFNLSIEKVGQMVGKERSTISNILRLLSLPQEVQDDLSNDLLQPGHVRPLINLPDEKTILKIKDKIIKKNLSARQVEKIVNALKGQEKKSVKPRVENRDLKEISEKIQSRLATKVHIKGNLNKGKIILEYYSSSELDRILEIIEK